jgi:hypothetical protein
MTRLVLGFAALFFTIGTAYTFAVLADPTGGDAADFLSTCVALPSILSSVILPQGVA